MGHYSEFEIELLCKFTPSEMVQMLHNLEVEFGYPEHKTVWNKGVNMGATLKANKIYRKLCLAYIKANLGVEIKE